MFERLIGKKREEEPSAKEIQERAEEQVKNAIDVINANMDLLPWGVRPWMDWTERPPRLLLVKRNPEADYIIHGLQE